jgi:SSS family solute:Na+ symporter/sodium/pantothenate symporter
MMLAEAGAVNWTLVTFLVYVGGVLALAGAAHHLAKRKSFMKEYFLGSRGLGVWAFAMTYAATSSSGGSFTGFPSLIYTYGWVLALWVASYMVVPICTMGLLGKRLNQVARKGGSVTVPDVFRDRHGSPALGLLTTVFIAFFLTVNLIAQFKAGGVIIQTLMKGVDAFDWISAHFTGIAGFFDGITAHYLAGLLLFAIIVVFYTAYGGFRAVVWTDVMQGIIMGLGVVILLPLVLHKAYVHLSPVETSAAVIGTPIPESERYEGHEQRQAERFHLGQLTDGLRKVNDHLKRNEPSAMLGPGQTKPKDGEAGTPDPFLPLGVALSFFFMWAISGSGQPGNWIRLMAFRDSKTLRRAIFTVTIYYGLIYLPLVLIFVAAKTLPITVEQADQAMPVMALFAAPPILAGLLIAAPFAAVMSTVDSFLLVISSAIVRDIYQRGIDPNVSERTIKRMSYATTAIVGTIVMCLAINPPQFLQDIIVFTGAGMASTFLAAMVLTLFWRRTTAVGAAAAMFGGFLSVAGLYLIGSLQAGEFATATPLGLHPIIWGLSSSLVVGIITSLVSAPPDQALVRKYFHASDNT